jgi:hypothetical protein
MIFYPRLLFAPVLVGGSVDKTAGTLTAPDIDCNINWDLGEEVTSLLEIVPTDQGESGQYTVQVELDLLNMTSMILLGKGEE